MGDYQVSPIADANCASINADDILLLTDDLAAALEAAQHAPYPFGAGILDCQTGELDIGYGFGVPCPVREG